MVLFREVLGWLRHLLRNDPDTLACGVEVQEIAATSASDFDTNDGARTLAIHRKADGLSPRIEVRFVGVHPQVYWVEEDDAVLIHQANQFGFPGDWFSYDVSDLCEYLVAAAKEKLCAANKVLVVVDQALASTNFKLMSADLVVRILDSLKANVHKKITRAALNKWLSQQDAELTNGGNAFDFAHSVIHHFKKETLGKGPRGSRKITWDDIDLLEDKFDPGHPIVEWSALKRWLSEPDVRGKLPPPILERVVSATDQHGQEWARSRMDGWLSAYVHGRDLVPPTEQAVALGQSLIAAFKNGVIPITYLSQAELADPYERLMPWSLIRRHVLCYKVRASGDGDDLTSLILRWLDSSDLLLPLYQSEDSEAAKEALKAALKAQLEHHLDLTLRNPAWIKQVLDGYVGLMPQADLMRAMQVDFDLWLFNALSPTVGEKDLPLSPYAFSLEKRDQEIYEHMIGAWLKNLKDYQLKTQASFIQWLTLQLESFYMQVKALWGKTGVDDYQPKMPSVSRILEAVKTGDKATLLSLLIEDLEAEVGTSLPQNIRDDLLMNPFFTAIYDAVRIQSVELP